VRGVALAFTDNPIETVAQDEFDFKIYVEILQKTLLQSGPLPFCIGIFGPWGSGKSSFMNMLKEQIENVDGVKYIWFNPWKYDQKDELWHALIQTILVELEKSAVTQQVKDTIRQLARSATWLAGKSLITVLSGGIVRGDVLDKLSGIIENKDNVYYRNINKFEVDFAKVVESYVGEKGKLVIFIDDLDRCLPENAITVLESLKLFIGHAQCIFVLGMDHYIVEEGISVRYEKKIKMTGRDYLDKIIQIPFYLPPVSYETLKKSLESADSKVTFLPEIWEIIRLSMGGNPRKTKRFVSSFLLLQEFLKHPLPLQLSPVSGNPLPTISLETQDIYVAKLLVFQMMFLDFYQHLRQYPDAWENLERLVVDIQPAKREAELRDNKTAFKLFVNDDNLTNFMSNTTGIWNQLRFPKAPKAEVVSLLLQATNLVSDSGPTTEAS
jgi:hypothetical protein